MKTENESYQRKVKEAVKQHSKELAGLLENNPFIRIEGNLSWDEHWALVSKLTEIASNEKVGSSKISRICKNCAWWDIEYYKDSVGDEEFENNPDGFCKRLPPTINRPYNDDEDKKSKWPSTYSTGWCGEFEQKATAASERSI